LSTEEWIGVINKAWGAGVPHLIFTGGEPTLREDLPDLIRQAENNGQVAGLMTDGRKLSDPGYLQTILLSGLDHLMVILQPADALAWQALEKILPQDLFTTVHLTITPEDREIVPEVLQKLARLGVTSISLTSAGEEMDGELSKASELAAELGMSLVWDLPVPYSARNPVYLESEEIEYRDGAGIAWMYVEPDGDVLPSQGINQVLGNLAQQDWENVWKK
jgi:MoaA/NifB/PqqE/SkfB family radical SAM enzyme